MNNLKIALMAMVLSFLSSHSQVYILKERLKGSYAALGTADNIPIGVASTAGYNHVAIQAFSTTKRDLVIQKIDQSTGATVWTVTNSNTSSIDPTHIITDASSNILVLGNISNTSGRSDIHLVKYNSSGVRTLQITYTNPLYSYEVAQKVQVDNSGNIYILGYGYNAATQKSDLIFLKYNSSGTLQFTINYSTTISNSFNQLTIDPLRNSIYIGGGANNKMVILSYNLTGTKLWEANYNGPSGMFSSPNAIVIDDSGNVFVLGTSDFNFVTIRYNRVNGVVTWLQRYAGPQNQDNALDMVIKNDAVYITGFSQGTNSLIDVVTICYNRWTGVLNWTQRYNGAFNGDDQGLGIKVDAQGFVYVMATEQERAATLFGYSKDAIVILYSPSGKYMHKIDYNGYNSGTDEIPKGMVIDAANNVYVTMATGSSGSVKGKHVKYGKINCFGSEGITGTGTGLTGVLKIASLEIFELVMDSLARATDDSLTNIVLQQQNSYSSIYSKISNDEIAILDAGGFPGENGAADPDGDSFIQDDELRQLVNSNYEMMIGNTLYKFLNDSVTLTIFNPSQGLLDSVRNNIPKALNSARVGKINSNVFTGGGLVSGLDFYFEVISYTATTMDVLFTPYGNIPLATCEWDFGDGSTVVDEAGGSNAPIMHTFDISGASVSSFNVSYTIVKCQNQNSLEGLSSIHQVNKVSLTTKDCNVSFKVDAISNTKVDLVSFSNPNLSIEWNFGDPLGTTSISDSPTFTYPTSGTYTVTLTAKGGVCDGKSYSTDILICPVVTSGCAGKCDYHQSLHPTQKFENDTRRVKYVAWYRNSNFLNYHRAGSRLRLFRKSTLAKWRYHKGGLTISISGDILQKEVSTTNFICDLKCKEPYAVQNYYHFPGQNSTTKSNGNTKRLRANFKVKEIIPNSGTGFDYGSNVNFGVCPTNKLIYTYKYNKDAGAATINTSTIYLP